MKIMANFLSLGDSYRAGKATAKCPQKLIWTVVPFAIEVKNLPVSVHTGIRTSAAMNADFLAKNPVQAIFDVILYGISIWLTLPSVKPRAIIFTCTLPTHGRLGLDFVFLRSFIPVQHEEKRTGSGAQEEK